MGPLLATGLPFLITRTSRRGKSPYLAGPPAQEPGSLRPPGAAEGLDAPCCPLPGLGVRPPTL